MTMRQLNRFPQGIKSMPPSKSVTHRAVICAGLAEGESLIRHVLASEDVEATLRCMRMLGARCVPLGDSVSVQGGVGDWVRLEAEIGASQPGELTTGLSSSGDASSEDASSDREAAGVLLLDCGESGSTLRFLMPLAACLARPVVFVGQGRLLERPLEPFCDLFAEHGVAVVRNKADGACGCHREDRYGDAGLTVTGPWRSGVFSVPGHISSQFVSGLLLALPLLAHDSTVTVTTVLESASYVDITLDVMRAFGVEVVHQNYQEFYVAGNQRYQAGEFGVEGDYSQAAFFLVAAALGCDCVCRGLREDSRQGDRKILDILRRCGAAIIREGDGIRVRGGDLTGITVDISDIPDLVAPLAVLLSFCRGESRIVNGRRLRYKESDRLAAVAGELGKLGADIVEGEDFLVIRGVDSFQGGHVDSRGDHRIAMMLAVAAFRCQEPVWLTGSESVAKSYPNFFEAFC